MGKTKQTRIVWTFLRKSKKVQNGRFLIFFGAKFGAQIPLKQF